MSQSPELERLIVQHRDDSVIRDLLKIKQSRKPIGWWARVFPPKPKTKPVSWS